jgi:hypothetical protein
MRAAIYARVSTFDQEPENQLQELRSYVEARGWTAMPACSAPGPRVGVWGDHAPKFPHTSPTKETAGQ